MSLHASGTNATIDLFEHHLVINWRQRGILFDGPDAEHVIPLASIKSVQFFRPSFMSPGKIVLVLAAATATRSGTSADPNTVFFSKRQLVPFENVLRAIQAAIATPSIERLAMAAQQQRSIDGHQSTPDPGSLRRIGPSAGTAQSGTTGCSDAFTPPSESGTRAAAPSAGGWWRDMPVIGKCAAVLFGLFMLLQIVGIDSPDGGGTGAGDVTTDASADAAEAGPSADQMMADWSEFATGERRNSSFGLTDGVGKPGEFCSASDGEVIMVFGDPSPTKGLGEIYDRFAKIDAPANSGFIGAFWFDRANGKLLARNLVRKKLNGDREPQSTADITMEVAQVRPGIVSVDGFAYHTCIS